MEPEDWGMAAARADVQAVGDEELSRVAAVTVPFGIIKILSQRAASGDPFESRSHRGGMAISRYTASAVLAAAILVCVLVFPQRAAKPAER